MILTKKITQKHHSKGTGSSKLQNKKVGRRDRIFYVKLLVIYQWQH